MSTPKDLLFSKSHEWVKINGNEAIIGISDFAQKSLGDVTYVELPNVGYNLKAGEEMGSIESVKAASDLYAPVSGKVSAVNELLDASPELVNSSPYSKAWIAKIELSGKVKDLMSAEEYDQYCKTQKH